MNCYLTFSGWASIVWLVGLMTGWSVVSGLIDQYRPLMRHLLGSNLSRFWLLSILLICGCPVGVNLSQRLGWLNGILSKQYNTLLRRFSNTRTKSRFSLFKRQNILWWSVPNAYQHGDGRLILLRSNRYEWISPALIFHSMMESTVVCFLHDAQICVVSDASYCFPSCCCSLRYTLLVLVDKCISTTRKSNISFVLGMPMW